MQAHRSWIDISEVVESANERRVKCGVSSFVTKVIDVLELSRFVIGDFVECGAIFETRVPCTATFIIEPVASNTQYM